MFEHYRKCCKCGRSPANDNIRLHRFPKPGNRNITRCKLWAEFISPDEDCDSIAVQHRLYTEHRMLCHKHFSNLDIDGASRKLLRSAVPCKDDDDIDNNAGKDRIAVPLDHEYVLLYNPETSIKDIDLKSPSKNTDDKSQTTSSIDPDIIHSNMMKYNGKLVEDSDSDEEKFNALPVYDECKQIDDSEHPNKDSLKSDHTQQFVDTLKEDSLKVATLQEATVHIVSVNEGLLETYKLSDNHCNSDNVPQNKDANDQTVTERSRLQHKNMLTVHDDSYTRYGLNIGDKLRKYDAETLANVMKAIHVIIHEADKKITQ